MADISPRCPKCQKTMERGHVPDVAEGQVMLASWSPGPPEHRRFLGGVKYRAKEQLPLSAFRCRGCGYVEFYASTEPGD